MCIVYIDMNQREFERFYKTNIDRIYRYVFFRIGNNRDVCEDLVSEIFMKAFKNFEKFDVNVSRSAWIYRIAHNHLVNYYRDKKETVDLEQVNLSSLVDVSINVDLSVELSALNQDDRKIVTLKYLLGYTYTEIGQIMGKSVGAVKMATHRALKQLKTRVTD